MVNNVISLGLINYWRRALVSEADLRQDDCVIDLCAGTGKVSRMIARKVVAGKVYGVDFCPEMLLKARKRCNPVLLKRMEFREGNIYNLNFSDNTFDCALVAFGLRNLSDITRAILEKKRVVKPGGKILSLDLAHPRKAFFRKLYYLYFDKIMPVIARFIYGDKEPYLYLSQSLKEFVTQKELKQIFIEAGLKQVEYRELNGGVTVIHKGINM